MNALLRMRPADPDDEPFLRRLRSEIDRERLFLNRWPEQDQALAKMILDQQFRAHATHHRNADWDKKDVIIELDGVPVGRFIVMQDSHSIHLADIEVAASHRNMGIGKAVIDGVKGESVQSRRPIRLLVDKLNTAVAFYLAQGFQSLEDRDNCLLMEWRPPTMPSAPLHFFGASH